VIKGHLKFNIWLSFRNILLSAHTHISIWFRILDEKRGGGEKSIGQGFNSVSVSVHKTFKEIHNSVNFVMEYCAWEGCWHASFIKASSSKQPPQNNQSVSQFLDRKHLHDSNAHLLQSCRDDRSSWHTNCIYTSSSMFKLNKPSDKQLYLSIFTSAYLDYRAGTHVFTKF
jgi:hypothetical protein